MRCARALPLLLSTVAIITDCRRDRPSSASAVLAKDTALASDLRVAGDTTAYGEAADVAMADLPDSGGAAMRVSKSPPSQAARPPIPRESTPGPASVSAPPPTAGATRHVARGDVSIPSAAVSDTTVPAEATVSARAARPRSVAAGTEPTSACESPAKPDQRRCLMTYLARSDAGLDRTYQTLIAEMKRKAGTAPGHGEPDAVLRLRAAQRAWLVYRDTECRQRNRAREGPLWAPVRAQCLGEFSGRRTEELAASLSRLQGR